MGRDTSIVQQVSYKAGVEIASALIRAGHIQDETAALDVINKVAESVFEKLKTEVDESAPAQRAPYQPRAGGYSRPTAASPGEVTLNAGFKKHAGKTIAAVQEEDPGYLDWILEKSPNDFIKDKVKAFRAA